jgi:hypothetical protein
MRSHGVEDVKRRYAKGEPDLKRGAGTRGRNYFYFPAQYCGRWVPSGNIVNPADSISSIIGRFIADLDWKRI